MNYHEWLRDATKSVIDEIVDSYASVKHGGWSENYITTRVLGAVERAGTELSWDELNQKIVWEGYKLNGKNETTFGDIAVFVRVRLLDDRYLEGVAFYEAKRQYFDANGKVKGFKAARSNQFLTISESSSSSNVLLYDVDPTKKNACATSVPTKFMNELAEAKYPFAGRILHRYGENWLSFLGANLKGFGLDFSSDSVQAIKDIAATDDAPFAVMNVAVGKMGLEPTLSPHFSQLPNYEKIWGSASLYPDKNENENENENENRNGKRIAPK